MGEKEMVELERLLAAATPGPWHAATAPHPDADETPAEYLVNSLRPDADRPLWVAWSADLGQDDPDDSITYTVPLVTGDGPTSEANAAAIVALVDAAPALIAAVRERDAVIAAQQAVIGAVTELADGADERRDRRIWLGFPDTKPPAEVQVRHLRAALAVLPGIEQEGTK